ncbi:Ricin-type beta-trefoil lectin domain-containing protein [Microbulbifer thermotolerans]|uniref:RICIN domain-containing protein n=1 Tax=Microbulbifer thermotolerans TaxID=252514 RepID=UPI0008DFA992|nr:RICIN domain-containing protein [Microbulbifer thermotolerans]SFB97565.1 Ricin-type beta-trefoil lectin domain-containing protein [Microbulbifer thermotolerans]
MLKICRILLAITMVAVSSFTLSAPMVSIDLTAEKKIGGVSSLDRSKYFNLHSTHASAGMTESELDYLVNHLNIGYGRQFWSPFSVYKGNAPYPSEAFAKENGPKNISNTKKNPKYRFFSNRVVVTDHPKAVFVANEDPTKGAKWAANYFKYYFDDETRPKFYEPINEPFVHADEFGIDDDIARKQITNLYKEIGKEFDRQNIDTKVLGYASAWPSLELWDFDHFNSRMKMFMDEAGPYMDGFSLHLYDGVNVTGANSQRSGSNLEAILDLVETYSYVKWNKIKPLAITEYGGIEEGYGDTYSDVKSVQSIRSINHMLFQLMERQDRLLTSIPFISDKSAWHYSAENNWEPYVAVLLRPDKNSIVNGKPTRFIWTPRVHFYQLWSEVKGKRAYAVSDNPDIQVQAFVSGSKAYVALNSLSETNQWVDLGFVNDMGSVTNVRKKSLKIYTQSNPIYSDQSNLSAPSSVQLIPGETVVLEYSFNSPIEFTKTVDVNSYYSKSHLTPIVANKTLNFPINGIKVSEGTSVLKLSVGRKHGMSLKPVVKVNGHTVGVPNNWMGGDQASRNDFFGSLHIPVNNDILKSNNTISVTFPDTGGRVSSVVLKVVNGGAIEAGNESVSFVSALQYLEPASQYTLDVKYSALQQRDLVLELWKDNIYLNQTRETVPAGSGSKSMTVSLPNPTIDGEQGYYFKVSIRPVGGDWHTNLNIATTDKLAVKKSLGAVIDEFRFADALTSLPSQKEYHFKVNFKAKQRRDIVVEIWNAAGWLSQGRTTVSAGESIATVTVQLEADAVPGNDYILKGSIRPVGADWKQNLDTAQINGIQVTSVGSTVPTGWTQIQVRHSSKCVDVAGGKTTNGSGLHQWTCDASNVNQRFKFESRGDGYYSIRAQVSDKCIDLAYGGSANGQMIQQYNCGVANENQHWLLTPVIDGWFELRAKPSGKCMDIAGFGQNNGAAVQQWACTAANNQQFKFLP